MGNLFSSLFGALFRKNNKYKIVMIGLDNSGKTTVLNKMKLDQFIEAIPTIGFNVDTVNYRNVSFNVWDVGGQEHLRPLWFHYLQGVKGIVYIVDGCDVDRFEEAKKELHMIMNRPEAKNVVLVTFINKSDLDHCADPDDMIETLSLDAFEDRDWRVQSSSAVTGDGINEGLAWLSKVLAEG